MRLITYLFILFLIGACAAESPLKRGNKNGAKNKSSKNEAPPENGTSPGAKLELSLKGFQEQVEPILMSKCSGCHRSTTTGPLGGFEEVKKLTVLGEPDNSPIYFKPIGRTHMRIFAADSAEAKAFYQWILGSSLP
jgi:hypothetical protein